MRGLASISSVAIAMGLVGAASAQTVSSKTMAVQGAAPQVCAVQSPTISATGALVNFRGLNGTTLQIDQLTDPQTLATRAASVNVSFAAVCNYPHRITVESQNNGLWRNAVGGTGAPTGFADGVPYTATLNWGDVVQRFEVNASSRRLSQVSVLVDKATAGSILLSLNIQSGASNLRANAPLIAGTYQDTLRVTVEPQ